MTTKPNEDGVAFSKQKQSFRSMVRFAQVTKV